MKHFIVGPWFQNIVNLNKNILKNLILLWNCQVFFIQLYNFEKHQNAKNWVNVIENLKKTVVMTSANAF